MRYGMKADVMTGEVKIIDKDTDKIVKKGLDYREAKKWIREHELSNKKKKNKTA